MEAVEEEARIALMDLVREHGAAVVDDSRRCEALLRDLCPGLRREVNVLISAQREGIPAALLTARPAQARPALVASLTDRLVRTLALAEEAARWAVECWAVALGVVGEDVSACQRGSWAGESPEPNAKRPRVAKTSPTSVRPSALERATQGIRPPDWPAYLSSYQPPEGVGWAEFRLAPQDGMPQVCIAAGKSAIGHPGDKLDRSGDGLPLNRVHVPSFWMDLHEVTVAQYGRFCAATHRPVPSIPRTGWGDRHPVTNVSWFDAAAYCEWVGRGLPTQVEWERAARGGTSTAYPWGATWDSRRANGRLGGPGSATPVNEYGPNEFGLMDMIGNVWEWCQDGSSIPGREALLMGSRAIAHGATYHVCRGGSWGLDPVQLRVVSRLWLPSAARYDHVGFRCCEAARRPLFGWWRADNRWAHRP